MSGYRPKNKSSYKSKANKNASERFKKITRRAQQIRAKHPKMKWKNAIKRASKELF
jgi:hypothetical protein